MLIDDNLNTAFMPSFPINKSINSSQLQNRESSCYTSYNCTVFINSKPNFVFNLDPIRDLKVLTVINHKNLKK